MVGLNSQKQYLQTYLSLIKKSDSEDIKKIYDYIAKAPVKDATKLSYLNSIISLKKIDNKLVNGDLSDIKELRDKLNIKIEKGRETTNTNERQATAIKKVSKDDLDKFVAELDSKKLTSIKALEDYLLIALMVKYPLRNDLQEIKLTNHKADLKQPCNSLYIPKKGSAILCLKEYKTRHANGADDIIITLDNDISNDIRTLVKHDINRKYLFTNNTGNPLSSSSFTHRLNRLSFNKFGVPISSTILRKIYITDKYADVADEMKKDATLMGHSVETQQKIYNAKKVRKPKN